jgi:hypothetical protein
MKRELCVKFGSVLRDSQENLPHHVSCYFGEGEPRCPELSFSKKVRLLHVTIVAQCSRPSSRLYELLLIST